MFQDKASGYIIGTYLHDDGVDLNRLKMYIQGHGYQLLKVANKQVDDLEVVDGYWDVPSSDIQYISSLKGRVEIEIRPASACLIICSFAICGAACIGYILSRVVEPC